jgi:DNA repair exonuclease SbcCD ATPase subunit
LNSTHFESGADDSELSLSVEIDFEEGGKSYTAKRERTFRKRGDEELFVRELFEIQNENGELIHPAQRWMNTLMPPNLIKFFFFPGEALDTFYNDENVRKLRQDIHTITKLDVLRRAAEIAKTSSAEIAKHLHNATVEVELRSALDAQGAAKTAVDFGETEEKRLSDEIQKAKNEECLVYHNEYICKRKVFCDICKQVYITKNHVCDGQK